ncbi:uncharacterized protein LOC129188546 [Dunckerocampus dactyliophorus]|uniref:uncharacterized protein LOC129188546 n=1 Tax=Dunckerocampus dactyliophorus TaxID=161453 RepID=UPI002406413B|nr:uncharacterized protein LOC129188546 [Dunckerocampus dactyliophorus]
MRSETSDTFYTEVQMTSQEAFSSMDNSCTTESLHRRIATNFGRDILLLVRSLEKATLKLADLRNHLRFNLRCRQSRLIPKCMRQASLEQGHLARKMQQNYIRKIQNLRIRRLNIEIKNKQSEVETFYQRLQTKLTHETYQEVCEFTKSGYMKHHSKTKERHKGKFQKLLLENRPQLVVNTKDGGNQTNTKENWIKNLSDRSLSETEKAVLTKGLNFSVTPKTIPTVDYITAAESAIRNNNLSRTEAGDLRLRISALLSSAKPPPSNITLGERKALAALQKDESITILPADKGRCTVVLNTLDYEGKITSLISDANTYEQLKRDPSSRYKKEIIHCLQKLEKEELIDRQMYHRLYPGEVTPCIYGLPKIHKEGFPLRPIVCSIDSTTYNVAKYVKTVLSPLVGNTDHHIENTKGFVASIKDLRLEPEETLVSYDVTSLFTSVPTSAAVSVVRKRLLEDSTLHRRTKLSADHICQLLEICLNTTYFQFRGKFYRQIHGCAMGSPVSPIVANLYMEEMEKQALTSFSGTKPRHWFRYVDDTFVIIKKQEIQSFTDHINAVDTNIKFTREDTKENQLAFLDCKVIIGKDRQLLTEVFRKATHTDQYLLFESNHPLQHKLGVIRTLQHRAEQIPTSAEGKKKETQHVQRALSTCGYPRWAFNKCQKKRVGKETQKPTEAKRRGVVVPYVAGVSEKLQRILWQHKIPTYFKPVNTLRQKLVHPKDKAPNQKQSNVVYSIHCKDEECKEHYIGETQQMLQKRLYQHRRDNASGPQSAVHLHLKATNHSFQDSEVKILAKENRWFERGVKEAIFVKQQNPSLNRNGGLRFNLDPVFSRLLRPKPTALSLANEVKAGPSQNNRC